MSAAVELPRLETLVRSFEAELSTSDGRTIDARIVPYNTRALVADPPDFRPYHEEFAPGAFRKQANAASRVRIFLNFEHDQSIRGIVGRGVSLDDRPDALYGSFRLNDDADGDKALYLVNEGLLPGLSVEFRAIRSQPAGNVVRRLTASIDNVALCRMPAYTDAQVLAVREQPDDGDGGDDEPDEPDGPAEPVARRTVEPIVASVELTDRLALLGVVALERVSTTGKAWDGSPARFTDEQYQRSTLLCRPGDAPVKERCSLPVLEPDGTLNTSALGAAAAALGGARGGLRGVTPALKAAAARKLVRYYRSAGMEPPESLLALARS